ncbi:MAG TPA: PKD domain-containing protein [Terriglobales bacterium]|nr:PKD domain-containing protein [Terriglobales bacterium]
MSLRLCAFGRVLIALALFVFLFASSAVLAQEAPPKVDVFAGYSWYNPGATVNGIQLGSNPAGFAISPTYNINRWFGLSVDGSGHWGSSGLGKNEMGSILFGPRFMARQEHTDFYAHGLFGWQTMTLDSAVPSGSYNNNGPAVLVGGGMDLGITKRFSWRVFEANYAWSQHNFFLKTQGLNGADLRSGLVFNFGGAPPLPPMAMSCSAANPAAVMAGEPVSVSANVTNIPPKHTVNYDWKTTGGKVSGNGTSAQVDTTGLAPGSYTVTATATDPKPRKGQGPVTCSSNFTVNEPPKHPPTASCSANPTTVRAGDSSTVSVSAESPDNRPLTYNYTTSAGRVSGTGASTTLDTAGAPAGPITVSATVSDDRGLTASCNATVNVEVPPPPPQASEIGTCTFDKDKKRPWRVDNACKAVLDDVALRLQREPDSLLVIVGHGDPATDKNNVDKYPAQRAVNSKAYLSGGEAKQQIDPNRVQVRTGAQNGQTVEFWLVPTGATFTQPDTQPVDENAVKPAAPKPAPAHKKKAAAPPAQ